MGKDWRDFKVENGGIAGARETFENACETLFKKQYPKKYVSQMEVSRGDGGIDIFIGKYSKEPIIVVQCKFFLEKFESGQKQQIKDSFNKAYNNQDYKLSKWILCIPRVFTQKDNEWWFDWIEKQDMDIKLINGNELISSMKEHDIYNQIFQMKDSLKIESIDSKLDDIKASLSNQIQENIKTDTLPIDQSRHITIELEPIDNDNFKIVILEESEENKYLKVKFSDDKAYTKNKIVDIVDEFIDEHCEGVASADIFLVFVLPSNLMAENIDFWKLSDEDRTLGDDYTILLRGRERFRKEGVFSRKRRYSDWKIAWENCQQKHDKEICNVYHTVKCGENPTIRRVKDTPFIVLDYNPNEENLKTLYRSHVSIMMWANNCKDKDAFLKLLDKHKSKKFGEIHTKLYEFKPNETGLDTNIMLLYDDPNKLPHDEEAPRFEEP